MKNKISFSIPGLFLLRKLNVAFVNILMKKPYMFNEDVEIGSVYGCFPCSWNGGRGEIWGEFSLAEFDNTVSFFNQKNIQVRLTLTNQFLKEDDMFDYVGNLLCSTINKYKINAANVRSQILWKYLDDAYPQIQKIMSTTLRISDVNEINEISKNNLLVPDYSIVNNFEVLSQLKNVHNIELLCAEPCHPNCEYRHLHQANSDAVQRYLAGRKFECPYGEYRKTLKELKEHPNYVSLERMRTEYRNLGINQFKISGRQSDPMTVIEHYVEYLIKPEYKDEVRIDLLRSI